MKRFLSVALCFVLVLSVAGISASALTFSDLEASHWAYNDVQTLVADGTVNGFEDGTFRPGGTVTRAQFVKMLGNGPTKRAMDYSDVSPNHWAYTYIMYAGYPDGNSNHFYPDQPITRGQVAELLWNRAGKPQDAYAPGIITNQYAKEPMAAAWVYEKGLMIGDDGIQLRLNDTLSRAEASVLIIRSRKAANNKNAFIDVIDPMVFENVFKGLNLFDGKAYDPNGTITNGEMARAALRIGSEETNLSYNRLYATANFDHPYARDLANVCTNCIGKDKLTKKFADQKAKFGDTVAALTYNFIAKSNEGAVYGEKTESLSKKYENMANICLTFAKNNGIISLNEDLDAPITMREFAMICLLLDSTIGSQSDITTDVNNITNRPIEKDHSLLLTKEPYGSFRLKLAGLPNSVYATAPVSQAKTPLASFDFAREYSGIFTDMLSELKRMTKDLSGADVTLTYYPSLVWDNGNGYTMRLKCVFNSMPDALEFNQMFVTKEGIANENLKIYPGTVVYFDLATGAPVTAITTPVDKAYVEQIVSVH